jgi:uracil-DNA glycosylase family 4
MEKSPKNLLRTYRERILTEKISDLEREITLCRRCPRLVEWRERMGSEKKRAHRGETYWARPVPGFGDEQARVLAVGLAPGAHGSNRTGRMFTGDASGNFLFPALYRAGFSGRPESIARGDGLALQGLFLTAVCRCAPPENKPTAEEIRNCLPFLEREIRLLRELGVIVALGKIAYDALLRLLSASDPGLRGRAASGARAERAAPGKPPPFSHGAQWAARRLWLIASYHPSRQNTQTGRLDRAMFDRIWSAAREKAYRKG